MITRGPKTPSDLTCVYLLNRLLDEAAEGLHVLSDKLPPPGTVDQSIALNALTKQTHTN